MIFTIGCVFLAAGLLGITFAREDVSDRVLEATVGSIGAILSVVGAGLIGVSLLTLAWRYLP